MYLLNVLQYVRELRLTSGKGPYLRDDSGKGITPSKGQTLHWPTAPVSHKPVFSPTSYAVCIKLKK